MKEITLAELAHHVGGKLHGDGSLKIRSASTLEAAHEGEITFLANKKYTRLLKTTGASAVVTSEHHNYPVAQIVAPDPYYAFAQIVILIHGHREHKKTGISGKATVAKSAYIGSDTHIRDYATVSDNARIGSRCVVYPGVFVGPETEIGDDCILYPNVVIYDRCVIGHRVIIQANATIGEDGFGFATHKGVHHKIPHIGRVIIEDDVEIGACAGIERGTLEDTIIGKGSKIGDLVAIGHGTRLGQGCLLVAQVGIAGSTTLGQYCMVGGQAGIAGHLKIGNRVGIGAKSGVHRNIADGEYVLGSPAIEFKTATQALTLIKSLPEFRKTLTNLEQRLDAIESKSNGHAKS